MPVDRINYSSLMLLLRNPLIYKMREILGVYDGKRGISAMIGSAGHEALKFYYGGNKEIPVPADLVEARGMARDIGLKFLMEYQDEYIEYGKTGSRASMLAGYQKAMDHYFAEEPKYGEILVCEEKLSGEIRTIPGNDLLPLPASGIPDLVHKREDGGIEVVDHKFVTSFTDYESEDYIKIIQAQFLLHLLRATKGIEADRVIFREIKRTENMKNGKPTGEPQVRDWVVPADHEPYRILFYNIYRDAVKFLSNPDAIFLPNLSDPFDGEQAGLIYAQGLINADMSDVEVMHKVRDVAFVSKKFIPSRLDRAENAHLLPEEKVRMRLWELGIPVEPEETVAGAAVTQYRFKVSAGISMTRIKKHKDDIAAVLEAKGEIRILTPIPGTSLLGIEVENEHRSNAKLGKEHLVMGTLSLPIGTDVNGEAIKVKLDEMPHVLVAGATGSGKSVLVHNFLTALTKQMTPEELQLVLLDPKRVELAAFGRKKHVRGKVLTDYEDMVRALLRLVDDMERRYVVLERAGKSNIDEFNASKRDPASRLAKIVCAIDEFADLMLTSKMKEKKGKAPAYSSKSKHWLYKELMKRGGKVRTVQLPDDKDPERTVSHRIGVYSGYTRDDLADILEDNDSLDPVKSADVEMLVIRLAQMGRAAGIHLIVATQRPSADVITGLIKANFPTRIALTTASAVDSSVILGKPGAEKLSGKGDMLLVHPAFRGEMRLQGFSRD